MSVSEYVVDHGLNVWEEQNGMGWTQIELEIQNKTMIFFFIKFVEYHKILIIFVIFFLYFLYEII